MTDLAIVSIAVLALLVLAVAIEWATRADRPSGSDLEYWLEDDDAEELRKSVRKHRERG